MWRPMSEAKKNGTPILAAFCRDLKGRSMDAESLQGRQVVIRHPGWDGSGFDVGWNLAGPFGYGGLPDSWFAGWQPLQKHPED